MGKKLCMNVTTVTTTQSGRSIEECAWEVVAVASNMGNKVIWDHGLVSILIIPDQSCDEALSTYGIVLMGLTISAEKGITKAKEVGKPILWKIYGTEVMINPTDEPDNVLKIVEEERERQASC